MAIFFKDLAYAVRLAARRPASTAITILTLALGIGGSSAIFTLVNGLFLRPLPVERPGEVVRIFGTTPNTQFDISSYANLADIGARSATLAAIAMHQQTESAYGLGDDSQSADIELVSGNYFAMLGVEAAAGRTLTPADDQLGAPQLVAVVSDAWWRSRLGARADAVGTTIHINGSPFTVVGVAPRRFRGTYDALGTDLWVPLMTYDTVRPRGIAITTRGWGWLSATARVKPGVPLDQAQADLDRVTASIRADFPGGNANRGFRLVPASALPEDMTATAQRVLLFALIAAALALAAGCANVANAQLATVFDRRREIAVRVAMGASRGRIIRQWLTESLLVAAAAAMVGTLASLWLQDAASGVGTPVGLDNFAPALDFDRRLLAFSTLLVAVVTMLFGGLPAMRAAKVDVAGPLKEESNSSTGGAKRAWAQAALVSAQVAVSVALLVSSAMLTRSLSASRAFDVGFDTANLVIASPSMANVQMDASRSRAYYDDTLSRVGALPGVNEVALGAVVPLGFGRESRGVTIDGYTPPDGAAQIPLPMNVVSANYFQVMRIPVRRGRAFTAADEDAKAPLVAVVNETMARQFWGAGDPIGRTIRIGNNPPVEIVGVAGDVTQRTPGEPPQPFLYLPFGPVPFPDGLTFHLRTGGDTAALLPALRRELRAFDARIQTRAVMPYEELRQLSLYPGRALVLVSGGFAIIALLLAVAGVYGVMIHVVTARRRELAVRLALGASPGTLIAGLLRDGLRWSVAGIVAGAIMAVSLAQLLERFLFGVSTSDAASIAAAVVLLLTASVAAAYAPARRIVRIDPASTLRS